MSPLVTDLAEMRGPVLHLSGPKLRLSLDTLLRSAEAIGGIEQLVGALTLRAEILRENLSGLIDGSLTRQRFEELTLLMATVRRRVGPLVTSERWPHLRTAIAGLLQDAHVPGTADQRIRMFETALASLAGERLRYHRDLAAEILHAALPEHYPLMQRWVWDATANTGALREMWFSDGPEPLIIGTADDHAAFLMLRAELAQFLSQNGIFRDMIWYVDLLTAQVYAGYVGEQGGAYLKTDFSNPGNALEHTLRLLGLDKARRRRPNEARRLDLAVTARSHLS
ncbi:MAG: hypothetical protein R3D57_20215 [Hyphomicrobiaceae bacterium]